jgi:hypothetical protein
LLNRGKRVCVYRLPLPMAEPWLLSAPPELLPTESDCCSVCPRDAGAFAGDVGSLMCFTRSDTRRRSDHGCSSRYRCRSHLRIPRRGPSTRVRRATSSSALAAGTHARARARKPPHAQHHPTHTCHENILMPRVLLRVRGGPLPRAHTPGAKYSRRATGQRPQRVEEVDTRHARVRFDLPQQRLCTHA